jgi:hypothetical protein
MANYLLLYHGGGSMENAPAEEQDKVMQAWMSWFEGLGSAVVDGGNPISRGWTISKDGTEDHAGSNPATGYSVISADSMQQALVLAKGCPHLAQGGSIEICETVNIQT